MIKYTNNKNKNLYIVLRFNLFAIIRYIKVNYSQTWPMGGGGVSQNLPVGKNAKPPVGRARTLSHPLQFGAVEIILGLFRGFSGLFRF